MDLAAGSTSDRPVTRQARGLHRQFGAFDGESPAVTETRHIWYEFVAAQPCLIRDRRPSNPHHIWLAQAWALRRKVIDEFAVSLCRSQHRELHRAGDERQRWERLRSEPVQVARKLWPKTRLNGGVDRGHSSDDAALADRPGGDGETDKPSRDGPRSGLASETP